MQLSDLNSGTPDKKPWLNPVVNSLGVNDLEVKNVDAVDVASNRYFAHNTVTLGAAGTYILTASQVVGGIFYVTSGVASTFTMPTAADLAALQPSDLPTSFTMVISNAGSGTVSVNLNTGLTCPTGGVGITTGLTRILTFYGTAAGMTVVIT